MAPLRDHDPSNMPPAAMPRDGTRIEKTVLNPQSSDLFHADWFWMRLLPFCCWEERMGALLLHKFGQEEEEVGEAFWSLMCMRLAEERHLTLMPRRFFRVIKVKNAKQYFWQLWSLRNRFFGAGSEQLLYYFEDGDGVGVGGGDRERPAPHGLRYDASIADKGVKGKESASEIISEGIPHQQNLEKVDTHSAGGGGRQKQNPASEHEADEDEPQVASVGKSTSVDRDLPDHEKTALLENSSSAPGEDDSAPTSQVFQTVCRFRPKACFKETAGNKAVSGNKVTIPLHQRVALLREKGYSKIDAQQKALAFERSLHEARKGRDEQVGGDSSSSSTSSAQVGGAEHQLRASILNYTSSEVFTLCPGVGAKRYGFDHVFGEDSKTGEVFDHMLPLINSFLNGEDSCVFCYGQTGSGKTFTMFGKECETSVENLELLALNVYPEDEVSVFGGGGAGAGHHVTPHDHFRQGAPPHVHVDLQAEMLATTTGLIPQSLVYLLRRKPKKLRISLSFVEVFGHTVRDLLTGKVVPSLVSDPPTERPLEAVEDIHRFLQDGSEHKRAAATAMNEKSTRAHAVVLAKLFCPAGRDEADSLVSQLILLDLGGSEKLARSKVHELVKAPGGFVSGEQVYGETTWQEYYQSRTRVQETAFINLGLLSLKRCIAALLEEAREVNMLNVKVKNDPTTLTCYKSRIPFYDSKLTQIMRPSLLSRNLLCVICAGVEDANAVESIASLRFGEACRQLGDCSSSTKDGEGGRGRGIGGNNSGKKGSDLAESVRVLDLKIAEVREQIKKKERWEWREAKREHVVDTMDTANTAMNPDEEMELGGKGAVEFFADDGTSKKEKVSLTVAGQQLVGAEEENELLAKLLDQRRMLTGE